MGDGANWAPNLSDAGVNKGVENLLVTVRRILYQRGVRIVNEITDENGLIAFETIANVVVAKSYIYGNVVSAHKKLIDYADANNLGVLMYIGDAKAFYRFQPKDVLKTGSKNLRGRHEMLNWTISLGTRAEVPG